MPYENIFTETDVQVTASDTDPLEPCKVEYKSARAVHTSTPTIRKCWRRKIWELRFCAPRI